MRFSLCFPCLLNIPTFWLRSCTDWPGCRLCTRFPPFLHNFFTLKTKFRNWPNCNFRTTRVCTGGLRSRSFCRRLFCAALWPWFPRTGLRKFSFQWPFQWGCLYCWRIRAHTLTSATWVIRLIFIWGGHKSNLYYVVSLFLLLNVDHQDVLAQFCQFSLTFAMSIGLLEKASESFQVGEWSPCNIALRSLLNEVLYFHLPRTIFLGTCWSSGQAWI